MMIEVMKKMELKIIRTVCVLSMLALSACEDMLDIPQPTSKIPGAIVFEDDAMANSALAGIFRTMYTVSSFAGGSDKCAGTLAGLSSDELKNNIGDPLSVEFQTNDINPSSLSVETLWASLYKVIFQANSAIEGLDASTTLSTSVKTQLTGEAMFIRGFCYFHLVNLFGKVPLALTTDYEINAKLSRSSIDLVNDQIQSDLLAAETLLSEDYNITTGRIRPNKFAATAMLARFYAYKGDWGRAEEKSSNVIARSSVYELVTLNNVFLIGSREAIWQLRPDDTAPYTNEGLYFSVQNAPIYNVLTDEAINAFEGADNRKANWTVSLITSSDTLYMPNKYKKYSFQGLTTEYSVVLRLAEVYLLRAEARARQDKLALAIGDVDEIRYRAGLPLLQNTNPTIGKDALILAIEQEKRVEFMTEWGHRWFDLKRWGRANAVLGDKADWSETDELYPVPAKEIRNNSNLAPQNQGY